MREECIVEVPPVAPAGAVEGRRPDRIRRPVMAVAMGQAYTGDGGTGNPESGPVGAGHSDPRRPSGPADEPLAGLHERVAQLRRGGLRVDPDEGLGAARADEEPGPVGEEPLEP